MKNEKYKMEKMNQALSMATPTQVLDHAAMDEEKRKKEMNLRDEFVHKIQNLLIWVES